MNKYRKALILLVFIVMLLLVGILLRRNSGLPVPGLTPSPPIIREEVVDEFNTWQGLTPGTSTIDNVQQEAIDTIEYNQFYNKSSYRLNNTEMPLQVFSNKVTGRIDRIVVPIRETHQNHLQEVLNSKGLGSPDIELYVEGSYWIHVFLNAGVAFEANEVSGAILREYYFTPTSRENFLELWGDNLSEDYAPHEHGY